MTRRLDRRITIATFVLATLVMTLFALIIAYASEQIEHGVLDQLIISESARIKTSLARGEEDPLPNTVQMRSWLTDKPDDQVIPPPFRKLPIGIHHDISYSSSVYHVMREPVADGFLTLAHEINLVEAKEAQLRNVLVATVLLAPVLLILLSQFFTRRMTAPVMKLAEILRTLDPSRRNIRLGQEFNGQEVEAIARAFDRYQERLDTMVERELSFSAAASHELRTPLAVVGASAELLNNLDDLPEPARRQLGRISQAVNTMAAVVNSLLSLSRDHIQKPRSPLQIRPVVEEAIANCRDQVGDRDIRFEIECDPELTLWIPMGDFLIILGNLLQNAVRNTERGRISVGCDAHELVVSDTGRGMPREFARHIFDRHVQAHDSHGVGLGLHIVKRLCDRLGWPIEVESALEQGTTVNVYWSSCSKA